VSNLPGDLTGQEGEFDEETDPRVCAVWGCSNILCGRALDLGADNCCECDDRRGCPICFGDETDDDA